MGRKRKIFIYDTTLRDGTQGEGISFSSADKVLLAKKMDAFGIDYIEGGWPGSNPRDMEFFDLIREESLSHAKIASFGSTRRAGIKVENDAQIKQLIESQSPVITIFGKAWLLHVKEVLKTTPEENLDMITESIAYLKSFGREVIYDAEHFFDGYKDDPEFALSTLKAAIDGGADLLVLCDTNGGGQLLEFEKIMKSAIRAFPGQSIGVHCHNDCELGVALSILGIQIGGVMVQGTINGFGERVGNANLTSIIPNLGLKLNYEMTCLKNLSRLKAFSREIDRFANQPSDKKAPFVGISAFAHKGGVHANAAKKAVNSYEHISPAKVGNRRRILLSDMAGGSSVVMKARELGLNLKEKSDEMRAFLSVLKSKENQGYEYENADASFMVLLYQHFHGFSDNFKLVSYRTISEVVRDTDKNISKAVVKIKVDDEPDIKISIAKSPGPVGALDHAMRIAFGRHFPELNEVKLMDYKVRIIQTGLGTDSVVQVLMKSGDGREEWWTCGANPNIIEASWQALSDSFRYKMLTKYISNKMNSGKSHNRN